MTTILGIDPGSHITGYGVIKSVGNLQQYIACGCIRLAKSSFPKHLHQIFSDIVDVIAEFQPDEVAIEQVFVHANADSALKLGQARGAAIVAVTKEQLPLAEYSTRQVKQAIVGFGGADKQQVQYMIKQILKLNQIPPVDAADALAVALCHAQIRRSQLMTKLAELKSTTASQKQQGANL